jgi:hypothetical protein
MADKRGRESTPGEVQRITMVSDATLKRSRLDSSLKTETTPTDWLNGGGTGGQQGGKGSPAKPAPSTSSGRKSDGR